MKRQWRRTEPFGLLVPQEDPDWVLFPNCSLWMPRWRWTEPLSAPGYVLDYTVGIPSQPYDDDLFRLRARAEYEPRIDAWLAWTKEDLD